MAVLGAGFGNSPFSSNEDETITEYDKTTIHQESQETTPSNYVELFDLDLTWIGGSEVLRFTDQSLIDDDIIWRGNTYTPIPIMVEGFASKADASAPARPTVSISNANQQLLAYIETYQGFKGALFTRWRTHKKFLDGELDANPDAFYHTDVYIVNQRAYQAKDQLQITLKSILEKNNATLPARKILKDETSNNLHAPGVSRVRVKG